MLWLLTEHGVPLVAATTVASAGESLRRAIGVLTANALATDDGALPGGTLRAASLEDVMRLTAGGAHSENVTDEARELGVVCVLKELDSVGFVVSTAHYVRPVERDGAGHLQRRPPAILSAWDSTARRFDHFFWAITDELATRANTDTREFDAMRQRRVALLRDLVDARVFDEEHIRRHIDRAALVEAHIGAIRANPPN